MKTETQLELNGPQTDAVNRLKLLPGARRVTVDFEVHITELGSSSSTMTIRGGADGPNPEPCNCCGHEKSAGYVGVTLRWSNNKYETATIHVPYAVRRPYHWRRGRISLSSALDFAETYAKELHA